MIGCLVNYLCLQRQFCYSDTFPISRGCHCKRGDLYELSGHWHGIAYTCRALFARRASNATPPLPYTHFVRTAAAAVIDQVGRQQQCAPLGYHIWTQIGPRQHQVDKSCPCQTEFESEYSTRCPLMKKEIHTVEHAFHHLLPRQFFSLLLSLV